MTAALTFDDIVRATAGRLGKHDLACPECAAWPKRSGAGRRRKVLRVWHEEPGFATWHCARCGLKGHAHEDGPRKNIDPQRRAQLKAEAAAREQDYAARQRDKARYLWRQSKPAAGTIVETYLASRGIKLERLPATLRYLPPHNPEHHPAMMAPFGVPEELEPGVLHIDENAIAGVHLTLLRPDGRGKAGTDKDKIMVGPSLGAPLVLAPLNDMLGLAVTEGIEDALSVHAATGLGAWAAGSASRLPALADAVPDYTGSVTILADVDDAGQRGARQLARRLRDRGLYVEPLEAAA
jgi:Toprim domain